MWASKFCLCRPLNALRISFPTVKIAAKPFSRTFSTLNCFSRQLFKKHGTTKTFKLCNKRLMIRTDSPEGKAVALPDTLNSRLRVGGWLLVCSSAVYVTILLGGYTRLSEAGLSMVTWNFSFEKYPTTEEEWENEFKKYQEFPEFKILNMDITLEDFKRIWNIEYLHRILGRGVGFMFCLPALGFWVKGLFNNKMKKRVLAFGALIAAQGLLGWYMVKSGLEDRFHKETDVPRVSQYRLASHLGLALILFTGFVWTALDLMLPPIKLTDVTRGQARIRTLVHVCKGLIFLTALSGALVAGLDAGLIYNSFPKMGGKWIPDDILALSPTLKNFTENPTTVQFDHRILGVTTFSVIMGTWLLSRRCKLPVRMNRALAALALAANFQVILGITTLVHNVPQEMALTHQAMSVALLSAAIWAAHELKKVKYIPKI